MNHQVFNAAKNGDLDEIKKLHGRNPKQLKGVTFEGNTVLHIAAKEGHLELLQWILQNVKVCCLSGSRNADSNTPLHEAAKQGNEEIISTLHRYNKCPASKRNQFGESALLIASEYGHVKAVKVLLEVTPLDLIMRPRNDHQTCLHVAAYGCHFEVVKLILGRPSFLNILYWITHIQDDHGSTPLHAAVHGGDLRIVREIINFSPSNWNVLCLDISWNVLCLDTSFMKKHDQLGRWAVHVAAIKGWDMLEIFISSMPCCIEIRSNDYKTILHFLVENDQFQVAQKLLDSYKPGEVGKLVSYDRDINGNTALHLATMNDVDPQLVEYLISFPNVNVNAINSDGERPLDIALKSGTTKSEKIKCLLEDAGASKSCIARSKLEKAKDSKQEGGGDDNIFNVDTLVASLIAGITFQAIFSVPGGASTGQKNKHPSEFANLGLDTLFQIFLFSDSLALFSSLTVVIAWLYRERISTNSQEISTNSQENRSLLANFSVLSLGTSVVSTGLAFLSATILITVPRDYEDLKHTNKRHFSKYQLLLGGEIFTAFIVPTLALLLLSMMWVFEYYFRASIEHQARLRKQLNQVLIYIIPSYSIIFGIIVCYGVE